MKESNQNTSLHYLAQRFEVLKLVVTVQLKHNAVFPAYQGSMWHGWFGHALKLASEHAYFVCFGEHHNQQPKPYVICPSDNAKTEWQKGELITFSLTLFGEATRLVDDVFLALKLGESKGLGSTRVPFSVVSVATQTPIGKVAGAQVQTLADWLFFPQHDDDEHSEVAIQLETPLKVQHHGRWVKDESIPLAHWVNHSVRRLTQLARHWVVDSEELMDNIYQDIPYVQEPDASHVVYYQGWNRYSKKNQDITRLDGLKGQFSFHGNIAPVLPYLQIGHVLHIGKKTTFGLGKFHLILPA